MTCRRSRSPQDRSRASLPATPSSPARRASQRPQSQRHSAWPLATLRPKSDHNRAALWRKAYTEMKAARACRACHTCLGRRQGALRLRFAAFRHFSPLLAGFRKADRDRLFAACHLFSATAAPQRSALALAHCASNIARSFARVSSCHLVFPWCFRSVSSWTKAPSAAAPRRTHAVHGATRGHGSRALRRATPLPTLRPPDAVKLRGLLLEPRHFPPDQVAIDTVAAQEDLRRTVLADSSRLQHDDPIEAAQA